MKSNRWFAIFGVGVLALIIITYLFWPKSKPAVHKFETSQWNFTYSVEDQGPYGLEIFYDLLDSANAENEVYMIGDEDITLILSQDDPDEHDLYIFIGEEQYLEDEELAAINKFVSRGNSALCINNNTNGFKLFSQLNIGVMGFIDSTLMSKLWLQKGKTGSTYDLPFIYEGDTVIYQWSYFSIIENYDDYTQLGLLHGEFLNYFKIPHGDGHFFYHSNPYLFTNVSIWNSLEGLEYVEDVISFLPDGNIYWDERTKYPPDISPPVTSPLQFILNNPPLLWAYLIFIGGLLCLLIFNSKRKRKPIPGKVENKNHSKEFINTISEIYRNADRPDKLLALKHRTFVAFLNKKYFFNFNTLESKHAKAIAEKSEIEESFIKELILRFQALLEFPTKIKNQDLIEINKKIEYFYKNCK